MAAPQLEEPMRRPPPNDGPGPRGGVDCYYTSRVLDSTARYASFVKKLRVVEEEDRKGQENALKALKDQQISDFFNRCDRRSLLNNVANRVELCLASYQADIEKKKLRLVQLLNDEEEANIRKFVEQAQAGAAAIWQDKKDRLAYLLAKRKKENEDKYKDTPISKCVHALPCIFKLREKEAQEIQLYQIKEKAARKMAEQEFNKMWHAAVMKESEALAARMEYDTIQKTRQAMEGKRATEAQIELRRLEREKEKERLKQETLYFKSIWDAENKKEADAQRLLEEKNRATALDLKQALADREEVIARAAVENKRIDETWDRLGRMGQAGDAAKLELARRRERELNVCNVKMAELRNQLNAADSENDELIKELGAASIAKVENARCAYLSWSRKTELDVRNTMVEQIKEKKLAKEEARRRKLEEDRCVSEYKAQTDRLLRHKAEEDARARKQHQSNLLAQAAYNNLLKERALQEERDQLKKFKLATEEYDEEIKRILSRPFFTEDLHPFMKQMASGLQMKEKCPCSKPDNCAG